MAERPRPATTTLMRAILAHGPIIGADLAEKTGIPAKSIDAILAASIKREEIAIRRALCPEKRKELKHYMTQAQAEYWDEKSAMGCSELPNAHAMSAPVITPQNPVAAETKAELGKYALLLIDSADLIEVEELDEQSDSNIAKAAALDRIKQGHAARAVVIRILGEARRQVEWKEAA